MYLGYQNNKIKIYTETALDANVYTLDKVEETNDVYVLVGDEYLIESDPKVLQQAKNTKIQNNDTARDLALLQGVTYKNVLFDSDTDQKINILAKITTLSDSDTITWYGMNNESLVCTKNDLIAIGTAIDTLHTMCWTKNTQIKNAIENAKSIAELNLIEIDYSIS